MNKKTSLLWIISLFTLIICTACSDSSEDEEEFRRVLIDETVAQVSQQIHKEIMLPTVDSISLPSVDSISSTVLYVNPQINLDHPSESGGGYRFFRKIILPISIFALICATIVFLVYFALRTRLGLFNAKMNIVKHSIDERVPLPDSFYGAKLFSIEKKLQSGIVWLFIGLFILIFGILDSEDIIFSFSFVPLGIGLSRLAVAVLVMKKQNKKSDDASQDNSDIDCF